MSFQGEITGHKACIDELKKMIERDLAKTEWRVRDTFKCYENEIQRLELIIKDLSRELAWSKEVKNEVPTVQKE